MASHKGLVTVPPAGHNDVTPGLRRPATTANNVDGKDESQPDQFLSSNEFQVSRRAVTGTYFLDSSSTASAHAAAVCSRHSNGHVTSKNSSVSDGPSGSGSSSYCARNSQTSDTSSSALSMGSDVTTLSSVTDYCTDADADDENTNGLTDSILAAVAADSDNEDGFMESLSSSLIVRDRVREFLEKDPAERTDDDIEVLLDFMQHMPAFSNMTQSMRRALCSVMVFTSIDCAGTVVLNEGQELTSWCVVLNGHLEVQQSGGSIQHYHMGDSFGIPLSSSDMPAYHNGVMRTKTADCQYITVGREQFYRIMHKGEESITRIEDNGELAMVVENRLLDDGREVQLVLRASSDRLIEHLISHSAVADPTYIDDFFLTYRSFLKSPADICSRLVSWFQDPVTRDKAVNILLRWVNSFPSDFEHDSEPLLWQLVEQFESLLESYGMVAQLRQLWTARSVNSLLRTIILSRVNRDETLNFCIIGGLDKGGGVYVTSVEPGSKPYEAGLRRGDQILLVNNHNFERLTHAAALQVLRGNTHLSITVRFNALGFRDVVTKQPDGTSRDRISRKDSNSSIHRCRPVSSDSDSSSTVHGGAASQCSSPSTNRRSGCPTTTTTATAAANRSRTKEKDSIGVAGTSSTHTSKLRRALLKFNLRSRNEGSDSQLNRSCHSSCDNAAAIVRKGSTLSDGLLVGLGRQHHYVSDPDLTSLTTDVVSSSDFDCQYSGPEHVVKVFRADQTFRYLLVHKETTAHEVVMLSLTEFGISEPSCNYSLCEVTFGENGLVKTRHLAEQLDNLAEKASANSRYYLKNQSSTEPLVPDDLAVNISRELSSSYGSLLLFRTISSAEVAIQLTRRDFDIFRSIEPAEYINDLFELSSRKSCLNSLGRFSELVNEEMFWVASEVCSEQNLIKRMRIIKQFIKIAKHCKTGRNFNSMFAILSGLGHGSVARLKQTWDKLPTKYIKMFEEMQELMDPSRNMSKYRTMLNAHLSHPPVIPFFPLVKKDLTFIHFGNDSRVEGLVNFEKLRMIAKEVRQVTAMSQTDSMLLRPTLQSSQDGTIQRSSAAYSRFFYSVTPANGSQPLLLLSTPQQRKSHSSSASSSAMSLNAKKMFEQAQLSRRVRQYLSNLKVIDDESKLTQLSTSCEPPGKANGRKFEPAADSTPAALADINSIRGPMFGTDSPQAVRKMMQLSDKVKIRDIKSRPPGFQQQQQLLPQHSQPQRALEENSNPPTSPQQRHQHRQRPRLLAVSLSVESSSVTGQHVTSGNSPSSPNGHTALVKSRKKVSSFHSLEEGLVKNFVPPLEFATATVDSGPVNGGLLNQTTSGQGLAFLRPSESGSDSGRSSLASNDNHSIGSSDVSPIVGLGSTAVNLQAVHRHQLAHHSPTPQPVSRDIIRPLHPPEYHKATGKSQAAPSTSLVTHNNNNCGNVTRLQLPDYYTATKMLAERRNNNNHNSSSSQLAGGSCATFAVTCSPNALQLLHQDCVAKCSKPSHSRRARSYDKHLDDPSYNLRHHRHYRQQPVMQISNDLSSEELVSAV